MKKVGILFVFLLLFSFFVFSVSPEKVFAKPSRNPVFATIEKVKEMIKNSLLPLENNINNLITRVGNLETADESINKKLSDLKNENAQMENEILQLKENDSTMSSAINNLTDRIVALEQNKTPEPADFIFFNGSVLTGGAISPVFDAKGYSKITFSYSCSIGEVMIVLQSSPDQSLWFAQFTRDGTQCHNGGSVTLDTAGRYYRVETGATTNTSLFINALGHFYN